MKRLLKQQRLDPFRAQQYSECTDLPLNVT
jgi:hypothetical protein